MHTVPQPRDPAPQSHASRPVGAELGVQAGLWARQRGPGSQLPPCGPQVLGRQPAPMGPGQAAAGEPPVCLPRGPSAGPHSHSTSVGHGTDTCLSGSHATLCACHPVRTHVPRGPVCRDRGPEEEDGGAWIHLHFTRVFRLPHREPGSGKAGALQPSVTVSPPPGPPFRPPLHTHAGHSPSVYAPARGHPGQERSLPGAHHLCARHPPSPPPRNPGPFRHLPGALWGCSPLRARPFPTAGVWLRTSSPMAERGELRPSRALRSPARRRGASIGQGGAQPPATAPLVPQGAEKGHGGDRIAA